MLIRAAAKSCQSDFQHDGSAHGLIEACCPFFDLPDDHVWTIRRALKDRAGHESPATEWVTTCPTDHIVAGTCEAECQDVEIGYGPGVTPAVRLKYLIFRDREVPIDMQVRLHKSDRSVHASLRYEGSGTPSSVPSS